MKIQFDKSGIVNTLAAIAIVSVLMASGLATAYRPSEKAMAEGDGTATMMPASVIAGSVVTFSVNYTVPSDTMAIGGGLNITVPWSGNLQTSNPVNPNYVSTGISTATAATLNLAVPLVNRARITTLGAVLAAGDHIWVNITNTDVSYGAGTYNFIISEDLNADGTHTEIASSPMAVDVLPAPCARLDWSWSALFSTAGVMSGYLRAHTSDPWGNLQTNHPDMEINITSSSLMGVFSDGAVNITKVNIANGSGNSTAFYYNDTYAGIHVIQLRNHTLAVPNAIQNFEIYADVPTKIYLGGTSSGIAGSESVFMAELNDKYSNHVHAAANTQIWLNSTNGGTAKQFRQTPGGAAVPCINITTGNSFGNFYYYDELIGFFDLTATSSGLTGASKPYMINAAAPDTVDIYGQVTSQAGAVGSLGVRLLDPYGNLATNTTTTQVWLNSTSTGINKEMRLTSGGTPVPCVNITAGASQVLFYYYDTQAGTFALEAESGGLTGTSFPYEITPGNPHHVFLDGAATFPEGTNASYFVKIMDQYSNSITVASNTVVNLATNSTTGVFMHYITRAPITSVTIPAAGDTGNFNFTDTVPGAKNLIGNRTGILNASVTVWVLDATSPTIISSTPADGAANVTTAAGDLTITFSEPLAPSPPTTYPAENIPGIDYDNASWSVGNTVLTIPYGALADETDYYIDFTGVDVFDTSGNQLVGMNITFTTGDCTLPIITLDSPLDGAFIQAGTDIALTVTDINLDAVNYSVNGATAVALASPHDIETASWEDDIFIIVVTAADLAGNEAMETYIFTVDSTEPTITLNSPADGSLIMTGTVLDFTAADAHLGIVRYALDTNALQTFAAPYNLNTAGWTDGTHMVRIQADDTVGNTAVAYFNFTADGTAPTVISIVPADGTDNVALDTHIVITFSEPMDNVSVYSAIQFSPPITCLFEWNANNTVLTLTPTEDLAESTVHGISLGVGATDIVGNNLDSAFSSSFATPTAEPIVEDIAIVIGPVLDADGNPIVGAAVVVTLGGEAYTGTTDADGNANITLPGTAVGEQISVEITKDGYRTVAYTTTIAADGTIPASDNPPTMEDEVDGDIDYTMIIIIVVAIIIVAIAVVFMLKGKKPSAPKSAEEPEPETKEPEQAAETTDE